MTHLTEQDLVLFYYGEHESAAAHLGECEACRQQYQTLQRTLNAVDSFPAPERGPDYESQLWTRLNGQMNFKPVRNWWRLPRWSAALALASLMVAAFFAGQSMRRTDAPAPSSASGQGQKVLLVAVGDHLERAQIVLAELANSGEPGKGKLDISYERQAAEDLVESNRLYRQTANDQGDGATASLLDDMERVLLEITHSPSQVSSKQLDDLRHAIEDAGLLFKVRVYQNQIDERDKTI